MSKIKSDWLKDTSVSGRTIYKLTPNYQNDVELSFKLTGTIPSSFMVGFGDTGGSPLYWAKCMWYKDGNTLKVFADNDGWTIKTWAESTSTVFKLQTSNLHGITPYYNTTATTKRNTNSSHPLNIRIDDFANALDLDYLKVKPL